MIRDHMGPVASFRLAAAIRGLPTTRSGKICRKSISDLARNKLKKVSKKSFNITMFKIKRNHF